MTVETGALVFVTPAPGPSAPENVNCATHNLLKSLTPDDLKRCIALLTSGSVSTPACENLLPGAELKIESEAHSSGATHDGKANLSNSAVVDRDRLASPE